MENIKSLTPKHDFFNKELANIKCLSCNCYRKINDFMKVGRKLKCCKKCRDHAINYRTKLKNKKEYDNLKRNSIRMQLNHEIRQVYSDNLERKQNELQRQQDIRKQNELERQMQKQNELEKQRELQKQKELMKQQELQKEKELMKQKQLYRQQELQNKYRDKKNYKKTKKNYKMNYRKKVIKKTLTLICFRITILFCLRNLYNF